jgi:hypothetical protein
MTLYNHPTAIAIRAALLGPSRGYHAVEAYGVLGIDLMIVDAALTAEANYLATGCGRAEFSAYSDARMAYNDAVAAAQLRFQRAVA